MLSITAWCFDGSIKIWASLNECIITACSFILWLFSCKTILENCKSLKQSTIMILCHWKLLPPIPRLQKMISCHWSQSISRCPVNASREKKVTRAHEVVRDETLTQTVLDLQITICILWKFRIAMRTGMKREMKYLASLKKRKHFERQTERCSQLLQFPNMKQLNLPQQPKCCSFAN